MVGPPYSVSPEVPESWVYSFRTLINGPTLLFEYLLSDNEPRVSPGLTAGIFAVTALCSTTCQEELEHGRDLWISGVAARDGDTGFVWYDNAIPEIGLTDAEFRVLTDAVPEILESVRLIPLDAY